MSLGGTDFDVTNLIAAILLLVGTWITARATKSNTKVQAAAQLSQVDQSAYNVAEGIFKSSIAQLTAENKTHKEKSKEQDQKIQFLEQKLKEQEIEINTLRGLIRNVE